MYAWKLVPDLRPSTPSTGRWAVISTDDPANMVVLGNIPLRPPRVTLWDAYEHQGVGNGSRDA